MSHTNNNPDDLHENVSDNSIEKEQAHENNREQVEVNVNNASSGNVDKNTDEHTDNELTIDELQKKLEAAEAKVDENWDTVLRLKADLDNQHRRSEKQVEDAHKYAVQKFVGELLPVADSLEMGMAAEGDIEQIREGIGLTMKVFNTVMEKFGIEAVDPLGEPFNPELHQAMAMQPSEEYEDGQVSAVMQKGYTLNGRLVRPAMVTVAKNQ